MQNFMTKNLGAIALPIQSVSPQSSVAASINGASIDRFPHSMPLTCILHQSVGALSGAPTTTSVVTKLQDSADGTNFADFAPDGVTMATLPALTAATKDNSLSIELTAARRFIRAVTTIVFTGGTTPAALVAADIIIGGPAILAQA